jgi:hypothetical protein
VREAEALRSETRKCMGLKLDLHTPGQRPSSVLAASQESSVLLCPLSLPSEGR